MANQKIGRFEILSTLGQGAMGVVYRATDPLLERTVAIKTISLELSKDEFEEFERRFYREASSAGRLNHPNIVTIHDVGNNDNIAYMAMEFLEGDELRDILDAGVPLTPERSAEIASQVADGLAFAHEHGVVHRDIKPSNIMILKNGAVKITDFGIALIPSSSRTMAGMILGSPKYMSPEQVVGQDVDGRSDIFSLGVVLYEMLTGKPPFSGDNISAIMFRILNEMPTAPGTLKPELPAAFNYIIAKALAKHPDERYQSAGEMAEDLRHYLALQVPANFFAHADGKSRTLERRARPRQETDETVLMAAGTLSQSATTGRGRGKKALLVGGGVVLLLTGLWLFSRGKPPVQIETQPVTSAAMALPPASAPVPSSAVPSAPRDEATLGFAIAPWGEVYVDGNNMGVTPPLKELKIAAGKHKVEIRNAGFTPYVETFELQAGATRKIKHLFK
ncbi:MAG: serine/threonine-protein kinase [Sulfurimicrobium sp.]|nr:serine/threonine-protein kinase [Sulfurimicrobium sp.]